MDKTTLPKGVQKVIDEIELIASYAPNVKVVRLSRHQYDLLRKEAAKNLSFYNAFKDGKWKGVELKVHTP